MDSDTMTRPEAYREVLDAFRARELDILVGTQMIAKGLDFPGVTLVGVISADTALALPDFRAAERTFQLLTQVAGRAGRGHVPGRVIVQSLDTAHYAVVTACSQDYVAFAERELEGRKAFGLPPFRRVMRLLFTARDEDRLRKAARNAAEILSAFAEDEGVEVLGPVPAPVYKLRGEFRHHALVKAGHTDALRRTFKALEAGPRGWRSGVQMAVDVDPLGLA
jgi:primosomal protein N' (replication factor Y)